MSVKEARSIHTERMKAVAMQASTRPSLPTPPITPRVVAAPVVAAVDNGDYVAPITDLDIRLAKISEDCRVTGPMFGPIFGSSSGPICGPIVGPIVGPICLTIFVWTHCWICVWAQFGTHLPTHVWTHCFGFVFFRFVIVVVVIRF